MTEPSAVTRKRALQYVDECGEYTSPFEREKIANNWVKKERDADNLVRDFETRAGILKGKRLLELGFGSGLHISAFVRAGAEVHGLEVNEVLLKIAQNILTERNVVADLQLYDGEHMPYEDSYFEYIFATSVLEHVSGVRAVLREADRILKPHGRFYISFPNRWAPRETHTGLWFIHYLPGPIRKILFPLLGSNALDELNLHFLSFFSLRRALRGTSFKIRYEISGNSRPRRMLKRTLAAGGVHHSAILKTVMVVLEKEGK